MNRDHGLDKAVTGSLCRESTLTFAPPPPARDRIPPYRWSVSQRYLSAIACGAAMLLLLLALSPGLRTATAQTAQEIRQFVVGSFTRPTQKAPPTTDATSGPGVTSEFYAIPFLSLEEAQRQVTFHIPTPAWLPAGLRLKGVRVMDPWVTLSYIKQDARLENAGFSINIAPGQVAGGRYIGVQRQNVTVNGQPAVYEWAEGEDLGTLSWQQDGFTYLVGGGGFGLSRDDLIRIAETLR